MKEKKRKRIIYIAPSKSSFIINDIKYLSNHFNVIKNIYNWRHKSFIVINIIFQFFFILRYLFSVDTIVISSGGYWAFLPSIIGRIFNIKVHIILNGSDCASIPPLNYGNLRKKILKKVCEISYKNATTLLPVSFSLMYVKNTFLSDDVYSYQGIKHFFPDIKTNYDVLYNGIDTEFWKQIKKIKKEPKSFISVISGVKQYRLKGGDLIIEVSKYFPDCTFFIAGLRNPTNKEYENVVFLGKLNPEELRIYYSKCQYHLQLSAFEGFGISLCEAMSCNCIPIGSSVNIIPKIIGESGYILNKKDPEKFRSLLQKILSENNQNEKLMKKARKQIVENFQFDKRIKKLKNIIENKNE